MIPLRLVGRRERACTLLAVLVMTGLCLSTRALAAAGRSRLDPSAMGSRIDQYFGGRCADANVKPAGVADDAEFLRRIYLDLAGRIPSVAEARMFLDDSAPDKRARLVDSLLESAGYVNNFTNFWRALMLPDSAGNIQFRLQVPDFEAWLRKRLRNNVAYDELVRELLTAGAGPAGARRVAVPDGRSEGTASAFYQVNENKPENLAAATSRLFLGVKLECAQCHDHPFAQWKREQFWSYAAFFGNLQPQRIMGEIVFGAKVQDSGNRHSIKIPGTDKVVPARFLDGTQPNWQSDSNSRTVLADWVTARENQYFARAAVNRLWAHFFGHGLVEPVDDLLSDQGGSHPELLDELARQFADHKFDVKYLVRAIVLSRTYQRTSAVPDGSPTDPRLFAHMAVKGLSPEQLFDSLAQATGWQERLDDNSRRRVFVIGGGGAREEFIAKFANASDKRTEVQTSILQALSLMNGKLIDGVTSLDRGELLPAVADAPFMTTPEKIETLYLAALSRKPAAKELERLTKYINDGDGNKALADVFWALLNSSEFVLNH